MVKEELAMYLLFIKEAVNYKVWDENVRDDVVQETFIKLFKSGFFEKEGIKYGRISNSEGSYITKTIINCFYDILRKRSHKGYEMVSIENIDLDEIEKSHIFTDPTSVSIEALEALKVIEKCFDEINESIKDRVKRIFLQTAFWESHYLDVNIKELAHKVGYAHTNPTQEFNRFVVKVSKCTQKQGIKVKSPRDQIEFLVQIGKENG